jgi:hypothetical protein
MPNIWTVSIFKPKLLYKHTYALNQQTYQTIQAFFKSKQYDRKYSSQGFTLPLNQHTDYNYEIKI